MPHLLTGWRVISQIRPHTIPDGDVRERPKRHDWKSCDPKGSKGSNPFVSANCFGAERGTRALFHLKARPITLEVAVLGGGLGVPCTGNPRYAGLINHPRPLYDRAAPGEQC